MSLDPRPAPGPSIGEVRSAARRQARLLSGAMLALFGIVAAFGMVVLLVLLDYRYDQDPHRLVKILGGATAIGAVVVKPAVGLLLIPVITMYLPWVPPVPVPGINALNVILFSVFGTWALGRVIQRKPIFRGGRLAVPIAVLLALSLISIGRGAAIPAGFAYHPGPAAIELFRSAMTFSVYFIALAMVRGRTDRRRLVWAVVVALLAESVTTLLYGRNGRGGRALGTFGQSNELGAYLAMFTAFAAALLPATRRWMGRLVLMAAVVAGCVAEFFTLSRGGIVALAAALVFVAVRSSRALMVILLIALATSPWWTPDYVRERMLETQVQSGSSDQEQLDASSQARLDTWKAVLEIVSNHPVDGVGFAGLASVLPTAGAELGLDVVESSHNTYLRMLAELGLFGLIAFLWLMWRCWTLARDAVRRASDAFDRQVAVAAGAAVVAMAVSCLFGDRFYSILITGNFWITCALLDDMLSEPRPEAA